MQPPLYILRMATPRDDHWVQRADGQWEPRALGPGFHARVYALLRRVPAGRVTTYGDLAGWLGSRQVARQVGYALAALTTQDVPWHRVLNAQGRISPGREGPLAEEQRARLIAEGVEISAEGRVNLRQYRWQPTEPPSLPTDACPEDAEDT